jgi:hypothetical protein
MFKVEFTSIFHELVTFHPYQFVVMLHKNINFHVFVSSFHNHNSLMGVKFFFDGELVSYGLNQYLGVDGSIHIFTWCDY